MKNKNYCPECGVFLPSEDHKPKCTYTSRATTKQIQEVIRALLPAYCPNCGELYERTDVKEKGTAEPYWTTFCGYCGAVYAKIQADY